MSKACGEVVEIARQDAELQLQIEAFLSLLAGDAPQDCVADGVRELILAVGMHFGYEEFLMVEGAYPQFDHHRRQHIAIVIELGLLLDWVADGDFGTVRRSVEFLQHWYHQHMALGDKELLDWLAARA